MNIVPSSAIRLFGTQETVEAPVILKAGPLTAELEDGNLRYIRFHGSEMLRAVSFIVRDRNWGTYRPQISDLSVKQTSDDFIVSYEAVARDERQALRYRATIQGERSGRLSFVAEGEATTDFLTNRTGFVVLHPIEGVAGETCTVEHVDGSVVETRFPDLIDPVQPMLNLRALTHEFAPGFKVTCRMEGDAFEMEDQRNWTDASYKTYVRPLALPWPYTLKAGDRINQRIELSVSSAPSASPARGKSGIRLLLEPSTLSVPPLGFGLDPNDAPAVLREIDALRETRPRHVVCAFDPGRGHDEASLAAAVEAGRALAADLWLEAVIRRVDGYEEEVRDLGRMARNLNSPFGTVLVSPAPDLKCTLPGSPWPPCPPLDGLYHAAREAFPSARLGGGMFSFFTELNRKRPPAELLDLVTFTTSPLVHAGDDRSVTESLESLPTLVRSVKAFINGKPFHVGPSAIGMRGNPYGAAPMENPGNIRQAMNRADPRQRGLLGAAWALGYFAHFARGGACAVTLGGGAGPFGLVHTDAPYAQPYFEDRGGCYPVFHVFKGLSALAGHPLLDIKSSEQRIIQATGAGGPGAQEAWLANLTGQDQTVTLWSKVTGKVAILDEESFEEAVSNRQAMDAREMQFDGDEINLSPYAVARLRF
jgi:hypothetical protein